MTHTSQHIIFTIIIVALFNCFGCSGSSNSGGEPPCTNCIPVPYVAHSLEGSWRGELHLSGTDGETTLDNVGFRFDNLGNALEWLIPYEVITVNGKLDVSEPNEISGTIYTAHISDSAQNIQENSTMTVHGNFTSETSLSIHVSCEFTRSDGSRGSYTVTGTLNKEGNTYSTTDLEGTWQNTVTVEADGEAHIESSVLTIDSQGNIVDNVTQNADFGPYSGEFGSVSINGEFTGTFTFSMTDADGNKTDHKQTITCKLISADYIEYSGDGSSTNSAGNTDFYTVTGNLQRIREYSASDLEGSWLGNIILRYPDGSNHVETGGFSFDGKGNVTEWLGVLPEDFVSISGTLSVSQSGKISGTLYGVNRVHDTETDNSTFDISGSFLSKTSINVYVDAAYSRSNGAEGTYTATGALDKTE